VKRAIHPAACAYRSPTSPRRAISRCPTAPVYLEPEVAPMVEDKVLDADVPRFSGRE